MTSPVLGLQTAHTRDDNFCFFLHPQQIRVIQHNLVYAVGISLNICREEVCISESTTHWRGRAITVLPNKGWCLQTLEHRLYFGQFGKIKKVSKQHIAAETLFAVS